MVSFTKKEVDEIRAYDASLNEVQKEWVAHKCNWEQRGRLAILTEYKGYIDNLATTPKPPQAGR